MLTDSRGNDVSAVICLYYGVCKSFFANSFLLKNSLQTITYKIYSSVENGAYGFERALVFVTIHPWEIVNGQLTNESARFDFCYVINVFICMIFRPDRVAGLLTFHQFTCCLLAEIHFARYEQNEF